MSKPKKPPTRKRKEPTIEEFMEGCSQQEGETIYKFLQHCTTLEEFESVTDTIKYHTPQDAIAFLKQRAEERAFLEAFLEKYGWPIGEGPPNYNAKIIPFPTDRIRR